MSSDHLHSAAPQTAAHAPPVAARVGRGARAGGLTAPAFRSAGLTFNVPPETRVALFELTSALNYPNLTGAGVLHYTVEPTPTATARQVWCHQFDPADQTSGGVPLRSYGGTANSKEETIYHPGVFRNSHGYAIGTAAFAAGDRVFCVWSRQSGRWEIIAPPLGVWRFELKTNLAPGSWATAYLLTHPGGYVADTNVEFTVYDSIYGTLTGLGKTTAVEGTKGYAQFMPDSGRWEIISMQHKARMIHFTLIAAMSYGDWTATGNVTGVYDGYHPDPTGAGVTLSNPGTSAEGYLFAGAAGAHGLAYCDPVGQRYIIIQMECP